MMESKRSEQGEKNAADMFLCFRINLPSTSNFLFDFFLAYSVSFPWSGDKKAGHKKEYQVMILLLLFENAIYNWSNKI